MRKAILDAAITGDAHAVAAWLDGGGDVDAGCAEFEGATVLIAAANEGDEAMVRMLLQRGASVNLQSPVSGTALMGAATFGHTTNTLAFIITLTITLTYQAEEELPANVLDTALKGDAQGVAAWLDEVLCWCGDHTGDQHRADS